MLMRPAISTNVAAVGYDPPSRILRVQFLSGGVYDYAGVAPALFDQLLLPNPCRRVGHLVKSHPFRRIS
jgi:hypothetical protein